jgi:hypothetical protein
MQEFFKRLTQIQVVSTKAFLLIIWHNQQVSTHIRYLLNARIDTRINTRHLSDERIDLSGCYTLQLQPHDKLNRIPYTVQTTLANQN